MSQPIPNFYLDMNLARYGTFAFSKFYALHRQSQDKDFAYTVKFIRQYFDDLRQNMEEGTCPRLILKRLGCCHGWHETVKKFAEDAIALLTRIQKGEQPEIVAEMKDRTEELMALM